MNDITTIDPRGTASAIARTMQALERRFEVVADNLANVETPGHKRLIAVPDGSSAESDDAEGGAGGAELTRDFTQGDLVETGDPTDLALAGEGFFAVEVDSEVRFIRSARFIKSPDGTLVDGKGMPLLGESGPVKVPAEAVEVAVQPDGTVVADKEPVGRLRVVTFLDPTKLLTEGGGRFIAPDGAELVAAQSTLVQQGFRERSNTDPVRELVEMIVVQRQYEAAQRALATESELRQRLNDLSG
jgi:flagellar basal body rod protein FlgG